MKNQNLQINIVKKLINEISPFKTIEKIYILL